MDDALKQLKKFTTIVSDTGEIDEVKKYLPTDATTNPSLIFAASSKPEYQSLIEEAISAGKREAKGSAAALDSIMDKLFVNFGVEILKIVPGRVSTEVDARLSFDTAASIRKAHHLIDLYAKAGIAKERVLIKLASTWEGFQAAAVLEKEGIHCNMTLLFSLAQAIGCAQVGATLVSPFVGRILEWHRKNDGRDYEPKEDPGVLSVVQIYNYYKNMGIKTQIMAASFRNAGEILELAGCDLITIAPKFLAELQAMTNVTVERKLSPETAKAKPIDKIPLDEKSFRWMMCNNPMATQKLDEGIVNFTKDIVKLEQLIASRIR